MRDGLETGGNKPISKTERDLADLGNEVAGRETGRPKRFLPRDHEADPKARERKAQRDRAHATALKALLDNDPAYRELYRDTFDKLRRAEAATEMALEQARKDLANAREELNSLKDKASSLPDGTRVLRDKAGKAYTEDGRLIEGDELGQVRWRADAPSYEEFLAHKEAVDRAQENVDEIRQYQVDVLGNARERLTNEDDPPSREELETIQRDLEDKAPAMVREHLNADNTASGMAPKSIADLSLPKLDV